MEPKQLARFWANVEFGDGCWNWNGGRDEAGYGIVYVRRHGKLKKTHAHRAIFEYYYNGPVDPFFVCHRCDNPSCVNMEHLFLGTNGANMLDMWRKGRRVFNPETHWCPTKGMTHCRRGHPLSGDNVYTYTRNGSARRVCRTCWRLRYPQSLERRRQRVAMRKAAEAK